jgi:hypothetical protein
MTDFDKTTEKLIEKKYPWRVQEPNPTPYEREGFEAGRSSAKESLEILARAVEHYESFRWRHVFQLWPFTRSDVVSRRATKAIAAVKARGDWPLEEKP